MAAGKRRTYYRKQDYDRPLLLTGNRSGVRSPLPEMRAHTPPRRFEISIITLNFFFCHDESPTRIESIRKRKKEGRGIEEEVN